MRHWAASSYKSNPRLMTHKKYVVVYLSAGTFIQHVQLFHSVQEVFRQEVCSHQQTTAISCTDEIFLFFSAFYLFAHLSHMSIQSPFSKVETAFLFVL